MHNNILCVSVKAITFITGMISLFVWIRNSQPVMIFMDLCTFSRIVSHRLNGHVALLGNDLCRSSEESANLIMMAMAI